MKMQSNKIQHLPTGQVYDNRKDAKIGLGGHHAYDRALKNGELKILTDE